MKTVRSARADRLARLRDLVVLGVTRDIAERACLEASAIEESVFIRESDAVEYEYSSIYRYLEALRFLGFDGSRRHTRQGTIIWSTDARELAECGGANFGRNVLSEEERAIFRRRLFSSAVVEQFFVTFCERPCRPENEEQFASVASPLYVVAKSVKRPDGVPSGPSWPSTWNVELSFGGTSSAVRRRPEMEFLYTYRLWCLDVGIVDELNVKEAIRYGDVPGRQRHVLYAIAPGRRDIEPAKFLDLIRNAVGQTMERTRVVPIPWLMYKICPHEQMPVEAFKATLVRTCEAHRNELHLERGPGILIAGKVIAAEREFKDRYGNHRYYPIVDGTVRSNLVLFGTE